ncbi:hypothetical protein N0Y54_30780 [Nostoc punctiforme UO1]|uniref:hypothetical protein n=1 Tax=Nostoc punctiforme TaxID=272131 RepID=UPI00309C9A1A
MGLPNGRESYGDGVLIVVVEVMLHQGKRESRLQGEVEQVIGCKQKSRGTRDAEQPKRY